MLRCRIGIEHLYIDLLHLQINTQQFHRIKQKIAPYRLILFYFVDNFATYAVVSGSVSHLYESAGLPCWVTPSAYRWLRKQKVPGFSRQMLWIKQFNTIFTSTLITTWLPLAFNGVVFFKVPQHTRQEKTFKTLSVCRRTGGGHVDYHALTCGTHLVLVKFQWLCIVVSSNW